MATWFVEVGSSSTFPSNHTPAKAYAVALGHQREAPQQLVQQRRFRKQLGVHQFVAA